MARASLVNLLIGGLVLAASCAAALALNSYYAFVIGQIALLVIAGVGLNLLIGLSGQISFGHAGFYAIGAYAVAIATARGWLDFWIAWPLGMLVAVVTGGLLALPALRVKGPYLAMVTIAFGLIVEQALVEMDGLTGGQNGILDIGRVALFGSPLGDRGTIILALFVAALLVAAYARLLRSPWGAAMRAVRDSETAAASIGIDPTYVRIVAFMISAGCAALAGGLSAPINAFVTPHAFDLNLSIVLVLVVIIGGAGRTAGPVLGAVVVGLIPELLSAFEAYRVLAYGALVLVVLWIAPQGLAGLIPARRTDDAQPAPPDRIDLGALLGTHGRRDLDARGLSLSFGGVKAIDAVDLAIPAGAVTALIGPNGAGKSTLVNMLSGFYRPDAGERRLGDAPLDAAGSWRVARSGIARTYQASLLFESLSVEANLLLAMRRGRLGSPLGPALDRPSAERTRAQALLAAVSYAGAATLPASGLPHVDRRLVEIARALATGADIVLLDEPAAGLSQAEKRRLGELLRDVAGAGIGLCLIEHDMALVMGSSDHVVVLSSGRRIASGAPAQVKADPAVREAYLGETGAARPAATRKAAGAVGLGAYALHAGYGGLEVLHGVDVEVRRGETVALLGSNGAGKSTLMKCLAGLLPPVQGHIRLDGKQIDQGSAAARVRGGMALVPEGRLMFAELSVADNIRLGGYTRRAGARDRLEAMFERFPQLRPLADRRAGLLSGGEQQLVALARALMSEPTMLLLDEPSLGLAPQIVERLYADLERLREEGLDMLIVDQMADMALWLADRVYVFAHGEVMLNATPDTIGKDAALVEAYLG